MVAKSSYPRWTSQQYLEMERDSTVRHECVDGHVYALAGGTQAHGVAAINIGALLRQALRGSTCRVFSSDVKVRVAPEVYLYPDISVSCDPADRRDRAVFLGSARLVVEVLSDSTATYDRGDKFALYQQHAALQDYVLVETRWQAVEVRSRNADGTWRHSLFTAGEQFALPSLDATLEVAAVYEDIDVPTTEPAA